MKKRFLQTFILLCCLSYAGQSFAQLIAGDIAFLQYNGDGLNETIKFLALVDIPAGTEIKFTDKGWKSSGSFRSGEGIVTWTAPAGGISCGTVVSFFESPMALSISGDQILAYTGTIASPTFIAAIHMNGDWDPDATTTKTSAIPMGLTNGTNCLAISPEVDNAKYNGILTGTKATLRAAINNSSNWITDDSNQQDFTETFTITDCSACAEPTTTTTDVTATPTPGLEGTSIDISWTNGNGSNRIVVVREASAVTATPTDNSTYNANATFGLGDDLGSSQYVIYNGSGSSVTVDGLNAATTYHIAVFEYECTPSSEDYLTTINSGNVASATTEVENPIDFAATCIQNGSVSLSWTLPAVYDGVMVLIRETSTLNTHSVNSINGATQAFNTDYTLAPNIGSTAPISKVVYNGTGTSTTITGLTTGSTYQITIHTYKGAEWSAGTGLRRKINLNNVNNPYANSTSTTMANVGWMLPGCYDEILVVADETSGINFSPTGNGSTYTANSTYSAPGQVIYKGTGSTFNLSGLTQGTTYSIEIFVRNGTEWSTGEEVSLVPAPILHVGDLAIIAFDNNIGNGTDKVSIVNLVDLVPGTSFDLVNMVYEAKAAPYQRTQRWYDCTASLNGELAGIRFVYNGSTALPSGSIMCFELPGTGTPSSVDINGVPTTTMFTTSRPLGNTSNVNVSTSAPDAIFLTQGTWIDQGAYLELDGRVLGGVQDGGIWYDVSEDMAAHTGNDRRISRKPPEIECFAIQAATIPSSYATEYKDVANHNGSKVDILSDIIDFSNNWTTGSSLASSACTKTFAISGTVTPGIWTGAEDDDWFNCANWQNLVVPDATTDVTVSGTLSNRTNGVCVIDRLAPSADVYGYIAQCKNLTIGDEERVRLINARDSLIVNGDFLIQPGSDNGLDMNTGAGEGTVFLHGNWTNNDDRGAFDQGNGMIQFVGSGDQTISTADAGNIENFYNILIDKPTGHLISTCSELAIKNNLDFRKGILKTTSASDYVLFELRASATGATNASHIDGLVMKETSSSVSTTFRFPTGNNEIYAPITIETRYSKGEYFMAQYFNQGYGDYTVNSAELDHVSTLEYWILEDLFKAGESVKATLSWRLSSAVTDPMDLRVGHFKNGKWEREGNSPVVTGTLFNGEITSDWITSFSPFTLARVDGGSGNPLPLDLLNFHAKKVNVTTELDWQVANDQTGDRHCVERSTNAQDYETLHCIDATEAKALATYQFTDDAPISGDNYYRIAHTDVNGVLKYSPVRALNFTVDNFMTVYPNPANTTLSVSLSKVYDNLSLEVIDALGRVVIQKTNLQDLQNIELDLSTIPTGHYMVRVKTEDLILFTKKIQVKK